MTGSVAVKTLRDLRRSLAWWSAGLAGLVAMVAAVFPTISGNEQMKKLIASYPEAIKGFVSFGGQVDYTSGPGYLGSELFAIYAPLLLIIAAIGAGARATAGEEEAGTLDLLLANPVSRERIVIEKLLALAVEASVLGFVLWCSLAIGVKAASMHVGLDHLAEAVVSVVVLAVGFGAVAAAVGAATGRRAIAIGATAALAVAAYLVNSLAPLVHALQTVRKVSPFYHYSVSDPLRHGLELTHVGVLLAIVVVAAVAAPLLFERRDLTA